MANTNLKKTKQGYGYKYTELAQIHDYLESINSSYYQYVDTVDSVDYIYTVPIIDGKEQPPRRGCRIVNATLSGKTNPAQEQGSAITYARRYSLLMAFGLATEDDDGAALTPPKQTAKAETKQDVKPEEFMTQPTEKIDGNKVKAIRVRLKAAAEKGKVMTEDAVCRNFNISSGKIEDMTEGEFRRFCELMEMYGL